MEVCNPETAEPVEAPASSPNPAPPATDFTPAPFDVSVPLVLDEAASVPQSGEIPMPGEIPTLAPVPGELSAPSALSDEVSLLAPAPVTPLLDEIRAPHTLTPILDEITLLNSPTPMPGKVLALTPEPVKAPMPSSSTSGGGKEPRQTSSASPPLPGPDFIETVPTTNAEKIRTDPDRLLVHTSTADQPYTVSMVVDDLLETKQGRFYNVPASCQTVSEEFDPKTLLEQFQGLISGPPLPREPDERARDSRQRLKEYIGDITDEQFDKLANYCSEETLKMPYDIKLKLKPTYDRPEKFFHHQNSFDVPSDVKLVTVRRIKKRMERDPRYSFCRILKYRGDKTSLHRNIERVVPGPVDLEPGKELLFQVRFYRPFVSVQYGKMHNETQWSKWQRGPLLQHDLIFLGRQTLEELLDRIACVNDYGPRTDCSENPELDAPENVKDTFPSGFLFINNTFYVDMRHPRSIDYSAPIRAWAQQRHIGNFRCFSMEGVRFDSLKIQLGYPELYMHQGNCEHLFTFSEVRVLQPSDYCSTSVYPYRTALNMSNSINCTVCTQFISKWVVVGCDRIPFDPAYVCDSCFRQYNYVDGKKVGEFKAYRCFL